MEIIILKKVEEFIDRLELATQSKVVRQLELLRTEGQALRLPHSKKIADKLFELRTPGIQNVRLFYTFSKNSIFVISGFTKQTNKLPKKELVKALRAIALI